MMSIIPERLSDFMGLGQDDEGFIFLPKII